MLTCSICGVAKAEADYYGSCRATCKECYRARVRAYRAANIERIAEYDRNRPNASERAVLNKQNYRKRVSSPDGKKREFARTAEWQAKNAEKRQAHIILGNAIRAKKIIPQPCERCGFALGVHGHHEDYSKPLDVIWLCKPCHGKRHREINAERRRAA
jgi:hypothetical protein